MNNNTDPILLLCGICCLYPLLFFGLPAFIIGRYWGRLKLQSPVKVSGGPVPRITAPRPGPQSGKGDQVGFGGPR